ncbi:aldehyde dehydrogenase family protein [Cupriavidus pinatubonensis]|uniref:aldehyde dehydrogenase family protein n=1 Tax=Cupriavidus pinatubonensis TaxID=248026 RepID=UPI003144E54F
MPAGRARHHRTARGGAAGRQRLPEQRPLGDRARRIANDTSYGLAEGVWTQNLSAAHRFAQGIQAGTIWVNCYGVLDPQVGFGGYKLSVYGWKGAAEQVDSYLYQKAVHMNLG